MLWPDDVRSRRGPLCIPSALTTDVRQLKTSLRDLLFDGGLDHRSRGGAARRRGRIGAQPPHSGISCSSRMAARTDAKLAGRAVLAHACGIVRVVAAELMAAERLALPHRPRPLPRLVQMHTAVCKAANVDPLAPTRFTPRPNCS